MIAWPMISSDFFETVLSISQEKRGNQPILEAQLPAHAYHIPRLR